METKTKSLEAFLGIVTHIGASQVPFGAALSCSNFAQYDTGKIQKIPGIVRVGDAKVDGSVRIPLTQVAKGFAGDPVLAVYKGAAATKVVNLTADAEVTGPTALSSTNLGYWSYAFYAQKHLIAGDGNVIQEINAATTRIDLVGVNVPAGSLIASYLDRLYVSGIAAEEGIVRYSTILGLTFDASAVVNVKELPGVVTALAINSPTSADEGVGTDLIIAKAKGMWLWNEQRKIQITSSIGTKSPKTFANTPVGTFFLGRKGGTRLSVFYMPVGSAGEPRDVGVVLQGVLANLANEEVAFAVYHDGFYKLYFSKSGLTNQFEVWLDVDAIAEGEDSVIWYGVHERGGADSGCVTDTTLDLSRKADVGVWSWFRESASTSGGFIDADAVTLVSSLDLPLNVEPINDEKLYEVMELWLDNVTNVSGNGMTIGLQADGVDKGGFDVTTYDETKPGSIVSVIPLRPAGNTGMAAQSAKMLLYHNKNKPFSITEVRLQYVAYSPEEIRIRGKVKA